MIIKMTVEDMSKTGRIILISICGSLLLVCGLLIGFKVFINDFVFGSYSNDRDNQNPQKQEEMLSITLEWGRLAPLPDSKNQFHIQTEGGAFTRSFRSSFYLSKEDLDGWVQASPGLQDAEIETVNNSTKKYIIKTAGGASYGEAVIDFDKCYVEIYVYWS
jgi:hypothetical protein